MKNKSQKSVKKGILITGVMIPITDPAEQAELDRRFREAEKTLSSGHAGSRKPKPRKGK
jgi:hypothetical protein